MGECNEGMWVWVLAVSAHISPQHSREQLAMSLFALTAFLFNVVEAHCHIAESTSRD